MHKMRCLVIVIAAFVLAACKAAPVEPVPAVDVPPTQPVATEITAVSTAEATTSVTQQVEETAAEEVSTQVPTAEPLPELPEVEELSVEIQTKINQMLADLTQEFEASNPQIGMTGSIRADGQGVWFVNIDGTEQQLLTVGEGGTLLTLDGKEVRVEDLNLVIRQRPVQEEEGHRYDLAAVAQLATLEVLDPEQSQTWGIEWAKYVIEPDGQVLEVPDPPSDITQVLESWKDGVVVKEQVLEAFMRKRVAAEMKYLNGCPLPDPGTPVYTDLYPTVGRDGVEHTDYPDVPSRSAKLLNFYARTDGSGLIVFTPFIVETDTGLRLPVLSMPTAIKIGDEAKWVVWHFEFDPDVVAVDEIYQGTLSGRGVDLVSASLGPHDGTSYSAILHGQVTPGEAELLRQGLLPGYLAYPMLRARLEQLGPDWYRSHIDNGLSSFIAGIFEGAGLWELTQEQWQLLSQWPLPVVLANLR